MDKDGLPFVCEGYLGQDGLCSECGAEVIFEMDDLPPRLEDLVVSPAWTVGIERFARLGLNSRDLTYQN